MSSEEGQARLPKAACEPGPGDGRCLEARAFSLPHTLLAPCPALSPTQSLGPRLWGRCGGPAPSWAPSAPRIHAEFQLSEPPDFPFWFSPGQFTGHIILSKDATHVRDFRLFVPNHRWGLRPKPPAPGLETVARGPLSLCPFFAPRATSLGRDLELTRKRQLEADGGGSFHHLTSMSQVLHGPGPPALCPGPSAAGAAPPS